ncbi:MAG TPA: hypothetical protein VE958_10710 [Bryobacteraceae bacterium]|jgi:hypothetical protein|nr:hypothetical protein [Bryobacteraceae bacterium]
MKFGIASLAMVAAVVTAAQDAPVVREGAYWVGSVGDSFPIGAQSRLQVNTRGNVVVRRAAGDLVTYRVRQRVRAASEDQARALLGGGAKQLSSVRGRVVLDLQPISARTVKTDIEIGVPPQVSTVIIQTDLGAIDVADFDGAVQLSTNGGEIQLGKIGGSVQCFSGAGQVVIERAGGAINCTTVGGNILVRDAGGPVALSNQMGGNIRVDKAAGDVRAHSAQGMIEVGQAGGAVFADTQGGFIQVGSARGVQAESMAGMVRVKNDAGPMNLATMAGSILAELLTGARMQDSSLVAGAGDITVLIPSNLAVSVMARNSTGGAPRIISEFPEIRVTPTRFFQSPLVGQGAINGGGPVLSLNASSGVIYLRRK